MKSKADLAGIVIILVITAAVFAGTLSGEFVYDDNRQILRNTLIQSPAEYGRALTSDVWAFKGDGTIAASNYYRPTFTAWLIVNYRLFGAQPFGWHLTNILLHLLVCFLAYALLRRIELPNEVVFVVVLLFSIHPVHTESVAWISGSPDLLFAAGLIGSLLAALSWRDSGHKLSAILAVLLYCLALGAKEVAMLCPPLFLLLLSKPAEDARFRPTHDAFLKFLPFALAAAGFFIARWTVLGKLTHPVEDAPSRGEALLTIPSALVFYFRQMIWPVTLAENYPLRPVAEVSFSSFVLPLLLVIVVFTVIGLIARRSKTHLFAAALLFLPLLPSLNISAFPFDQIVHDRYLYLPILGFLILVFVEIGEFLTTRVPQKTSYVLVVLGVLIAVPLSYQTVRYNRVWLNSLSLWSHNVEVDPNSALSFVNYGWELASAGRHDEAVAAFSRSFENRRGATALLGRARSRLAVGRRAEAIRDFRQITSEFSPEALNAYTLYQAYEGLAVALTAEGLFPDAITELENAIRRLPIYRAALTEKLAVVLYQRGDKQLALARLEAVRGDALKELLPESKTVLLRLGQLYAESGRRDESRLALNEFLTATASFADPLSIEHRATATTLLRSLR